MQFAFAALQLVFGKLDFPQLFLLGLNCPFYLRALFVKLCEKRLLIHRQGQRDLRNVQSAVTQIQDLIQAGDLLCGIQPVSCPLADLRRCQKANLIIVAKHTDRDLRQP